MCVTPKASSDYPLAFMLIMEAITYDPYVMLWRRIPTLHIKMDMEGMANTRANARRYEEGNVDQDIPLQVPPQDPLQAPIDPIVENTNHTEFRSSMQLLAKAYMDVGPHVNPNMNPAALRLRKLAKSRPTVRRSDHGPWSVSVDRGPLYLASDTNDGRPAWIIVQCTVRRSDRR
uniref:Uncharacterized protein n=1 Tax=Solanum tuberosum TaxID=4113 RepID=M1DJU5_SOLTU